MTTFKALLKERFTQNMHRHEGIRFDDLSIDPILDILSKMELSGGEVDVLLYEGVCYYVDFSKETLNRRSLCYDQKARINRKNNPPISSAIEKAQEMGITLLDEAMYKYIQSIEDLDLKTSSWLLTPDSIRRLGGAIFGDKRYQQTFIYHNSADSYYSVRGFRGYIECRFIYD